MANAERIDQGQEDKKRRSMDHIERNHMLHGKQGKSVFLSTNRCDVWALIQETLTNPDTTSLHRSKKERLVYKKNFATPVGVDGLTGTWCYFVTIIYDMRDNFIITAFPSV